jgi:hypothetical protein
VSCGLAVVIVVTFEGEVYCYSTALHDTEQARLDDWLATRPEYQELVALALRLADVGDERRAA